MRSVFCFETFQWPPRLFWHGEIQRDLGCCHPGFFFRPPAVGARRPSVFGRCFGTTCSSWAHGEKPTLVHMKKKTTDRILTIHSFSSVETVFGHTRNRGCRSAALCGRRAAANELCVSRPRSHACFLLSSASPAISTSALTSACSRICVDGLLQDARLSGRSFFGKRAPIRSFLLLAPRSSTTQLAVREADRSLSGCRHVAFVIVPLGVSQLSEKEESVVSARDHFWHALKGNRTAKNAW